MAAATLSVVITMIGPRALGRMCRTMMRAFEAPLARAASTNSFSLSDNTVPRMIRAAGIQKKSDRMRMISKTLPESRLEARIRTTRNGIAKKRSVIRIRS